MSRQETKNEIAELVAGSKKDHLHTIIYAYNGRYKSHDIANMKRHSIDKLTVKEAKNLLLKNPHIAIMLFLPTGKTEPAWMKKVLGCVIPVDPSKEKLLENFFNYEFPPVDYASTAEYYKAGPPPGDDLSYPVDHLWMDYVDALALKKGSH